jgi:starvation-inducible outer membrane lipoprotein
MNMNMNRMLRLLVASAPLLIAAGCATGPEAVENDFGNSVRHMTQAQTANPTAPADSNPLDHGDGVRINGAIEAYRKGTADPKAIKEEMLPGSGN